MNRAQWDLVFGPVVWLALACGHVHYSVIYFQKTMGLRKKYGGIPHITILAGALPWFAIALKLFQIVFVRVMSMVSMVRSKGEALRTTRHTGYKQTTRSSISKSLSASEESDFGNEPGSV